MNDNILYNILTGMAWLVSLCAGYVLLLIIDNIINHI
jgi:hypothetical protein